MKATVTLSQRDKKIFLKAIMNPREPNEALKTAAIKYEKELKNIK